MNGEFNPYTPPEAGALPRGIDVAEGRLWIVEGGRLFVRDHASLPDVCVLGTVGKKGTRTSTSISAAPRWMKLFVIVPLLWIFFADDLPDGPVVVALAISLLLPMVMAKRLQVMVFQSRWKEQWLWATRTGIWVVMIGCSMRIGDPFVEAGLLSESASEFLPYILFVGAVFITGLLPLDAATGAVAAGNGWFELKGVRAAVIERLAEVQQRVGRAP